MMSVLKTNKGALPFLLGTVVLGGLVLGVGSYTYTCYTKADAVAKENAKMMREIQEWKATKDLLDKQEYRPVEKAKIDSKVNSKLLHDLQKYKLTLTDFKDVSGEKKGKLDYNTYSLIFTGSYEETVKFFSDFHASNALLTIRRLKIDPQENNMLQAEIIYRAYVK